MMPNTSHAVMAQRIEPQDSLDDFPTPPWATRAFCDRVGFRKGFNLSVWEPAANRGYMARPLSEYFAEVHVSDVADYGAGYRIHDFLKDPAHLSADWIITNPPFRLALEFVSRGLQIADEGVAVLVRSTWFESKSRYEKLFRGMPPTHILQYSERVPMVKGRYDPKASTATGYAWAIWDKGKRGTQFDWIPPGSKERFERKEDWT